MFTKMRILGAASALLSLAFGPSPSFSQEASSVPPPTGIEVQTRGPVHEAFAQPFDLNPEPGLAVPKEPPPAVPELPPEERPQGDNVQWIGGYWAWDADRNDFLWVSGTYRNAPAGRQFIPGHWVNTPDGWRWVAGFWAPESQNEIPYATEPPAPLEAEPAVAPPDDNSTYILGYWLNQNSTFVWRPGFYTPYRAGRMWVSPRYIWTPAGYAFVDGYWDYPLADRGLLFAPVWFNRPLWRTPGWSYRPDYVVGANALLDSLFWRARQFYFGDYYGSGYARLGFQPWFANRYDPLFNYYRWNHRGDPGWAAGRQRDFNERTAGRMAAPPRTFAQQNANGIRVVTPLNQVSNNNVRLTRIAPAQAEIQKANMHRQNQFAQLRNRQEVAGSTKTQALKIAGVTSPSNFSNRSSSTGVTTRSTGHSTGRGVPDLNVQAHQGVVVRDLGRGQHIDSIGSNQPRVLPHNSVGTPRVITPQVLTPRVATTHAPARVVHAPQAQHHVAPAAAHAARTSPAHAPSRSGAGHRGGKR